MKKRLLGVVVLGALAMGRPVHAMDLEIGRLGIIDGRAVNHWTIEDPSLVDAHRTTPSITLKPLKVGKTVVYLWRKDGGVDAVPVSIQRDGYSESKRLMDQFEATLARKSRNLQAIMTSKGGHGDATSSIASNRYNYDWLFGRLDLSGGIGDADMVTSMQFNKDSGITQMSDLRSSLYFPTFFVSMGDQEAVVSPLLGRYSRFQGVSLGDVDVAGVRTTIRAGGLGQAYWGRSVFRTWMNQNNFAALQVEKQLSAETSVFGNVVFGSQGLVKGNQTGYFVNTLGARYASGPLSALVEAGGNQFQSPSAFGEFNWNKDAVSWHSDARSVRAGFQPLSVLRYDQGVLGTSHLGTYRWTPQLSLIANWNAVRYDSVATLGWNIDGGVAMEWHSLDQKMKASLGYRNSEYAFSGGTSVFRGVSIGLSSAFAQWAGGGLAGRVNYDPVRQYRFLNSGSVSYSANPVSVGATATIGFFSLSADASMSNSAIGFDGVVRPETILSVVIGQSRPLRFLIPGGGDVEFSLSAGRSLSTSRGVTNYWVQSLQPKLVYHVNPGFDIYSEYSRYYWSGAKAVAVDKDDIGWVLGVQIRLDTGIALLKDENLLKGRLYFDTNLNGRYDDGEGSNKGVVVTLNDNLAQISPSGEYEIRGASSGWVKLKADGMADFADGEMVLVNFADGTVVNRDIGVRRVLRSTAAVFVDVDGDGLYREGIDTLIGGANLILIDRAGNRTPMTTDERHLTEIIADPSKAPYVLSFEITSLPMTYLPTPKSVIQLDVIPGAVLAFPLKRKPN